MIFFFFKVFMRASVTNSKSNCSFFFYFVFTKNASVPMSLQTLRMLSVRSITWTNLPRKFGLNWRHSQGGIVIQIRKFTEISRTVIMLLWGNSVVSLYHAMLFLYALSSSMFSLFPSSSPSFSLTRSHRHHQQQPQHRSGNMVYINLSPVWLVMESYAKAAGSMKLSEYLQYAQKWADVPKKFNDPGSRFHCCCRRCCCCCFWCCCCRCCFDRC